VILPEAAMARRYTPSKYLQTLRLDDDTFVLANGLGHGRMIASETIYALLGLFEDGPLTFDELVEAVEVEAATPRETLAAMFRALVDKGLLVAADDFDEDAELRRQLLPRITSEVPPPGFQVLQRASVDTFEVPAAAAKTFRHIEIVYLGGCLVELVEEPLRALAASYGLSVGVRGGWLTDLHLLGSDPGPVPDLVIVQPGVYRVIGALTSRAFFRSDADRKALVDSVKDEMTAMLRPILSFGGHVLVQGISSLQMPPHGRADARLAMGHHAMSHELNAHLRALVAGHANTMFVDEERLTANAGKASLLDDLFTVTAHHGALDNRLPQLLAREYLDCYVVLSGLRRIKCIVTDLDNTLWQGVVGEGEGPRPGAHPFPAIRDALLTLRERGILLASCSKNNHDDVIAMWRERASEPEDLLPDDFVLHEINWDPKPKNLARIFDKLGLAPDAVLFIDDNPVERAEALAAFPELRVLGDDLRQLRAQLLTDPYLQPNVITAEARERTATTKAQLSRDEAREHATDRDGFLRSLEIALEVTRVSDRAQLDRLAELSQRTNQFNTTLVRYDVATLAQLAAAPDASVWSVSVRDRFAPYGIVGLIVIRGDEIENVCISCRAIGLAIDQPFLAEVLARSGLHARHATGRIVTGARNQPCRRVFSDAGFNDAGDGRFTRPPSDRPPAVDTTIFQLSARA
jgi:FkbH-like protein